MKRPTSPRMFFLLVVVVAVPMTPGLLVEISNGCEPDRDSASVLEITDGARLEYAPPWVQPTRSYENQLELRQMAATGGSSSARLIIQTEQRLDHEDSLRRLSDIATERAPEASLLAIAGWPAVRRRYREPLARTGAAGDEDQTVTAPLRLTTAVAFEANLIRFESQILTDEPTDAVAAEVERLIEGVRFDRQLPPQQLERELELLRQRLGQE